MDPMLLRIFQDQALLQCQFVLVGTEEFDAARARNDQLRMWYSLEHMIMAAANVAKVFWGAGGKLAAEREPIRASIGIDDSSPLRDVAMRNHFEHFDSRIDIWWANSERHNYIDRNIAPRPGMLVAGAGFVDTDEFRNFYTETKEMHFWGERFNLQAIVDEIRSLVPRLQQEVSKPPWENKGSRA